MAQRQSTRSFQDYSDDFGRAFSSFAAKRTSSCTKTETVGRIDGLGSTIASECDAAQMMDTFRKYVRSRQNTMYELDKAMDWRYSQIRDNKGNQIGVSKDYQGKCNALGDCEEVEGKIEYVTENNDGQERKCFEIELDGEVIDAKRTVLATKLCVTDDHLSAYELASILGVKAWAEMKIESESSAKAK